MGRGLLKQVELGEERPRKGSGEGTGSELLKGGMQAQEKQEKGQRTKGRYGSEIRETVAKKWVWERWEAEESPDHCAERPVPRSAWRPSPSHTVGWGVKVHLTLWRIAE